VTNFEIQDNKRALNHALAQQRLEGLTVSSNAIANLERVVMGEISMAVAINDLYARYAHVKVLKL